MYSLSPILLEYDIPCLSPWSRIRQRRFDVEVISSIKTKLGQGWFFVRAPMIGPWTIPCMEANYPYAMKNQRDTEAGADIQ